MTGYRSHGCGNQFQPVVNPDWGMICTDQPFPNTAMTLLGQATKMYSNIIHYSRHVLLNTQNLYFSTGSPLTTT